MHDYYTDTDMIILPLVFNNAFFNLLLLYILILKLSQSPT